MNNMQSLSESSRVMHHSFPLITITLVLLVLMFCTSSCSAEWTATQWNVKGQDYYTNGDYNAAIFAFMKSIDIDPIVASVWNNLGVTYEAKKMNNESIMAFRRALELNGGHDNGWCNPGYVYHM